MDFLPHQRASRPDSIFIHTSYIHIYCVSHSIPTSFLFDFIFLFITELKLYGIFSSSS